jgi:WD40 repeat protein
MSCLQVYHSALHFTPRQTALWNLYKHKRLSLGNSNICIEETWSPCVRIIDGHSNQVRSVAFSPNGTRIVSGSDDNTLRLWDAVSGTHLNTLNGHSSWVWSVAFSPDGTQIVSGSGDKTLRLWDAVSGTHLNTLNGHSSSVRSVTFSPDGTLIVSGSEDKTLRLWDAVSGTHLNTLCGHSNAVRSVAFSPDGTQIWCLDLCTHLNMTRLFDGTVGCCDEWHPSQHCCSMAIPAQLGLPFRLGYICRILPRWQDSNKRVWI